MNRKLYGDFKNSLNLENPITKGFLSFSLASILNFAWCKFSETPAITSYLWTNARNFLWTMVLFRKKTNEGRKIWNVLINEKNYRLKKRFKTVRTNYLFFTKRTTFSYKLLKKQIVFLKEWSYGAIVHWENERWTNEIKKIKRAHHYL